MAQREVGGRGAAVAEEDGEEDYSMKTLQKAAATKFTIQQYYLNFFKFLQEREQR